MDENKDRELEVNENEHEEDMSFPLDRTFEKPSQQPETVIEESVPETEHAEDSMSFPLDRTFSHAPKAEQLQHDEYSLYNIRPQQPAAQAQTTDDAQYGEKPPIYEENGQTDGHCAYEEPPKKKKKGGAWRIVAIILVAMMFGCALGVAVIVPAVQMLGEYGEQGDILPQPSWGDDVIEPQQPTENDDKVVHDYSDVDYPDALPEYDGESVRITDKYNPVPEIAEQVSDSVVGVMSMTEGEDGVSSGTRGTGMIISSEGYIITNEHVIASGKEITVTLNDGAEYEGTLLGVDESLDIAVIKIDAKGLSTIKLGRSSETKAGERVIAIGNPSGAGANLTGTVTVGYVSAVDREILFNDTRQKFIQTDAALNPGNSGGPLLNDKGEVVGVVTLKSLVSAVEADGTYVNAEGIGFAIPIDTAMRSINSIILNGDVKRPGLGVKIYEITEEQAQANDLHTGLLIESFISGSLAEQAGMEVGDIIIECEGEDITTLAQFQEILGGKMVGDHLKVTVWRDGKTIDIDVELSDMNKIG